MIVELVVFLAVALAIFYKWSTSTFDYFKERNLPYDKPFPLFGSQKDVVMRKVAMYDNVNRLYKKFNSKVVGVFEQRTPVYMIRDLALIKQITIKDFDHFVNHRPTIRQDDSFFSKSLAIMRDAKWKDMRSTLSPVFTGNKMRQMFTLINEVAHESMTFLKKDPNSQTGIEMNIKDYFTRFSNDVIASTAFGIKINSFEDENNEFYLTGKRVTTFTTWQVLKMLLYSNLKYLVKIFRIELFDSKDINYFKRLVMDAMTYRQEHKIFRPDMINMLMEAKGVYINEDERQKPVTNRQWTDDEIAAQCFLFFFAGFETTATLMSFAAHELMENPDIQEKLRQEITDVSESLDGEPLSYDALHGMKYMDMVISETLRRWPVGVMTDRHCNKDFFYKDDEIELNLKVGDVVWIPIVGIHMDEQYYPNPMKFDPERFSVENKANIQQFTYLPFGAGPRNCIANRFALQEVKAQIYYLLKEFRIEASAKTSIPIKLDPGSINLGPKNGFWVKLVQLVFGIFDQRTPVYVIRDLALIKQITIKDFDHFVNHRANIPEEHDGLFSNSLGFMRDGRWKDMRSTLSPVFTGSKMRQMFTLINEVARKSTEYLKKDPNSGAGIEMNIKDYFTRLSNDVIASSVFGLKINSFEDENNEFYLMGKKVTKFSTWQVLKLFMNSNFEYLMKVFKMQLFESKDTEYFKRLVLDAMKHRQEHKIFRPDMINMLMESKGIYINQGDQQKPVTNRQWTDVEIVAQCFLFFFAGFETTATLMSFAAHELMENPEIQEKLRDEIIDVSESLEGKPLTYESLHGMKYMDMVISESLRRWPVAVTIDRQCTKDFSYKDAEVEINLRAGDYIWIPIVGIHMDERYYPNPTKFDPERFSDENKANMQQFTYLPFGAGPRNCIGNRFALQEVKAIMFYLLKEFRIEAAAKTTIPVQLDPANINMGIKNGFWLKLVQLSK